MISEVKDWIIWGVTYLFMSLIIFLFVNVSFGLTSLFLGIFFLGLFIALELKGVLEDECKIGKA